MMPSRKVGPRGIGLRLALLLVLPSIWGRVAVRLPNNGKHVTSPDATEEERTEYLNAFRGFAEGWLKDVEGLEVEEEQSAEYEEVWQNITHRVPVERPVRVLDPATQRPVWAKVVVMMDKRIHALLHATLSLALLVAPQHRKDLKFRVQVKATADSDGYLTVSELLAPLNLHSLVPNPRGSSSGSGSSGSSAAAQGGEITVLCANVWNYNHWASRRHLLLKEVRRLSPDIIAFQEVRRRLISPLVTFRAQVEDLAHSLPGYQFTFAPAMAFTEAELEYVQEGLAIFSRYPILETEVLKLSRDARDNGDFHQRICQRATVQTPFGRVHVLNTHLSLSKGARERTLPEIGKYAQQFSEPVILTGDMNSVLETEHPSVFNDFDLIDGWKEVHPEDPPSTGWTFNSWEMKSRIDYLLLRTKDRQSDALSLEDISVEGDEAEKQPGALPAGGVKEMKDLMYPSDHRFLFARLWLRSQRQGDGDEEGEDEEIDRAEDDGSFEDRKSDDTEVEDEEGSSSPPRSTLHDEL